VSSESALRPIPISARQLQALVRMAEAVAKMRLSETVTKEDAKEAIELMKYYLRKLDMIMNQKLLILIKFLENSRLLKETR
jgi:replicative DNA helicase Mcm